MEHVYNPAAFLIKTKKLLKKESFIYLEVPDGEEASKKGKNREEFTIDHLHVFSFKSTFQLIKNAHLTPLMICRKLEPSGKFTIFAFLR